LRIEKANLEVNLEEKDDKLKVLHPFPVISYNAQKNESLLEVRSSMLRSKQQQIQDLSEQVTDISLEKEDALSKTNRDVLSRVTNVSSSPNITKESQIKNLEIKLSLAESKIKQQDEDIKFLTKLNAKNSSMINQLEEVKEGSFLLKLVLTFEEQQVTVEQMKIELESAKEQVTVLRSRKRYKLDMENRLEQLMVSTTFYIYTNYLN
jgi:hypothetical protein